MRNLLVTVIFLLEENGNCFTLDFAAVYELDLAILDFRSFHSPCKHLVTQRNIVPMNSTISTLCETLNDDSHSCLHSHILVFAIFRNCFLDLKLVRKACQIKKEFKMHIAMEFVV